VNTRPRFFSFRRTSALVIAMDVAWMAVRDAATELANYVTTNIPFGVFGVVPLMIVLSSVVTLSGLVTYFDAFSLVDSDTSRLAARTAISGEEVTSSVSVRHSRSLLVASAPEPAEVTV
jgi:hypothetical protein